MSPPLDLETLRRQVATDLEVFKAEKARFDRIQNAPLDELTSADRKAIANWSRSSIRQYANQLDALEQFAFPAPEQKEVMRLLNQLIMLGDQIGEFTASFMSMHREKMAQKKAKAAEEKATVDVQKTSDIADQTAEEQEIAPFVYNPDPKGIYARLGVAHDASMADVQSAKRKRLRELHPDRFPGDPAATQRFAKFQALCVGTINDEKTRKKYDNVTTPEDLVKLNQSLLGVDLD